MIAGQPACPVLSFAKGPLNLHRSRQILRSSGLVSRGCPISANVLEWEADSVAPAEALRFAQDITGAYLTITHSIDSRLRGNDLAFFRKHDHQPIRPFGTASGRLPPTIHSRN